MRDRRRGPEAGSVTAGGQIVLGERLAAFKRIYRWLNLTLVHQAVWPLLLLLTTAPAGSPEEIPMPWYLARIGGPVAAAVLALIYLAQRPLAVGGASSGDSAVPTDVAQTKQGRHGGLPLQRTVAGREALRGQVRFALIGLPVMVALARLVEGPVEPAAKLMLFGLADVAAFQLIHFGVVARSYAESDRGQATAVFLFGLSWGLRDMLLTTFGPEDASPPLAFVSGVVLGVLVGLLSRALRRWPGGFLPAAAVHWLIVYLIFGFVD